MKHAKIANEMYAVVLAYAICERFADDLLKYAIEGELYIEFLPIRYVHELESEWMKFLMKESGFTLIRYLKRKGVLFHAYEKTDIT